MKLILIHLHLILLFTFKAYSQNIHITGENLDRIKKACDLIKIYSPEIHESMVIHSTIISAKYKEIDFLSTAIIDENGFWIIIGPGSLTERSINRLAGTILHESLHMLLELQRKRAGDDRFIHDISKEEMKKEERIVYKITREFLVRLGTLDWEISEYDLWASAYD